MSGTGIGSVLGTRHAVLRQGLPAGETFRSSAKDFGTQRETFRTKERNILGRVSESPGGQAGEKGGGCECG
eukprot:1600804-Rhodomonas_salina.2